MSKYSVLCTITCKLHKGVNPSSAYIGSVTSGELQVQDSRKIYKQVAKLCNAMKTTAPTRYTRVDRMEIFSQKRNPSAAEAERATYALYRATPLAQLERRP